MSATGLISGTPTSQGTHAITVTVSDGQPRHQSWTLRVTEPAAGGPLEAGVTPSPKYLNWVNRPPCRCLRRAEQRPTPSAV
ncbi:putative Ig domain-containing protein [Comamonas sp. JC664]|uniref:putative Ig domain-containing protein n=1 Tax=Comamonas sp. JC664 TaxID=2801917 RepID=UPI00361D8573